MSKSYLYLLGIICLLSHDLKAQKSDSVVFDTVGDTIPFRLTSHNNISVSAILNEKDSIDLMFHTAANDVSIIKEAENKTTSIQWDRDEKVESWGGESDSRSSKNNSLRIGSFYWDEIPIWECKNSGPETDGKFGLNFFEGKIVEIDFEESVIILYNKIPSKTKNYQQLELIIENGFYFIEGVSTIDNKDFTNKFLIHSGYGGTILYDDDFVASSQIGTHLKVIDEKELKDSYGNVLKTKKAELPLFKIGTEELVNIPVGFFEGSIARQKMSIMGGDVLKRFNIIMDIDQKIIYMKQNELKSLPPTQF